MPEIFVLLERPGGGGGITVVRGEVQIGLPDSLGQCSRIDMSRSSRQAPTVTIDRRKLADAIYHHAPQRERVRTRVTDR
jgi:hypothetical protein